ncbi:MAG: ATP-dependent DNA helicase RecG [Clostridium sp.]|nr:ATP-dependent DNA helicase RecG [Clostridium sp.]
MRGNDEITKIKGIGDATGALLRKLDIFTVSDLLAFYPRRYERYDAPIPISQLRDGQPSAVSAIVLTTPRSKMIRNIPVLEVPLGNEHATLTLRFFHQPYLKKTFSTHAEFVFYGTPKRFRNQFTMDQPKIFTKDEYAKRQGVIWPIYPLTKGLSNTILQKAVREALRADIWEDATDPKHIYAVTAMHFPKDDAQLIEARRRLVFEEFYNFLLQLRLRDVQTQKAANYYKMTHWDETKRYIQSLPYCLTGAQQRVWEQLRADLVSPYRMTRLIQGDVGSGKTVLAILALLACVESGYQGAFMAPTEVLAKQHYETIVRETQRCGLSFRPILMTGSLTMRQKKEARSALESGSANVAIGTHALLEDPIQFQRLGLVVTDEQHRFGVRQREKLTQKGDEPHEIVMSATPIPRTLAITIYGNLPISVVDELPQNRLPVKSCVVGKKDRPKAYRFMEKEIATGHQVYVICPLVEAQEEETFSEDEENVIDYAKKLRQNLPETVRIQILHGKMKSADKTRIMEAFAAHEVDVLVSTTVIEVGINVPNATVMMIEDAQRFGLAQLHQLRGRVGRGVAQSYCIFINTQNDEGCTKRLEVLLHTQDGFEIAASDLKLRGPGDFYGKNHLPIIRQSGEFDFQLGDIYADADILLEAADAVKEELEMSANAEETIQQHATYRIDTTMILQEDIWQQLQS